MLYNRKGYLPGENKGEDQEENDMKAVITVIGRDKVGIIATVSAACSGFGVNIVDISQTVLDGYFAMIMLVEIGGMKESSFLEFSAALKKIGEENAVDIRVMHEDIFNSMHRI